MTNEIAAAPPTTETPPKPAGSWPVGSFGRYQAYTSDALKKLGAIGRLYSRTVGFTDVPSYGRFLWFRSALRHVRITPRRILDAGSGTGEYALWMADALPSAEVLGIDYSGERVQKTQAVRDQFGLRNVKFRQGDLTKFDAGDGWDLIYSVDVLEHIAENREVIRRFRTALTPGGYLLIRIPAQTQRRILPKRCFRSLEEWSEDEHLGQHFDFDALCAYLRDEGYEIVYAAQSSGFFGRLGFELSFVLNENAKLVYAALVPVLKGLYWVDVMLGPKRHGNGIVVLARRAA